MSIAFGASLGTPTHGASVSTLNFTTSVAVPSNGTALMAVTFYGNQTPAISGWTLDNIAQDSNAANFRTARFRRNGTLSSGSTVTVTFGGNVDIVDMFGEYVTSTTPLEVDAIGDGDGDTGAWSASVTTTVANTLLIASTWVDFGTDPNTPATDYTEIHDFNAGGYKCCTVYRIVSSTGTYAVGGTVSNGIGNATAAVAYREAVGNTAPSNSAAAVISGTAQVGQTLTRSSAGSWTGTPSPTVSGKWQRSDNGTTGWSDISGATGTTYALDTADEAKYVAYLETATNSEGSATQRSNVLGPVDEAPPLAASIHLTGGASNADPMASIGGAESSVTLTLSELDLEDGDDDTRADRYWCVTVHNDDDVSFTVEAWFTSQPEGQEWTLGAAVAGSGQEEDAPADNQTAPAGVTLASPDTEETATALGQADPGEGLPFWLHRPAAPSATAGARTVGVRLKLTEAE